MKDLPDLLIQVGIGIIVCAAILKVVALLIMWIMGV